MEIANLALAKDRKAQTIERLLKKDEVQIGRECLPGMPGKSKRKPGKERLSPPLLTGRVFSASRPRHLLHF
jgi:hypothetical protein